MPFQVIHFSSVDTDCLGDSKLFIDIVLESYIPTTVFSDQ